MKELSAHQVQNGGKIMGTQQDTLRRKLRPWLAAFALTALAATPEAPAGEMSADEAFAQLRAYNHGRDANEPKDVKALRSIERLVGKATADPQSKAQLAERFAAILADPQAPEGAKLFSCQQLAYVGSEAQAPVLAKMLEDPKTVEMARYTLQNLPGEAPRAALRAALDRVQGDALVGVVNSLGVCRDEKSVGALAKLLGGPDANLAAAAAKALGRIGTAQAAAALTQARPAKPVPMEFLDAQLCCAERLAAAGDASAAALYQPLWAPDQPRLVRIAALRGLVKTRGPEALPMVLEAMGGDDPSLQATAMSLLRQVPGPAATKAMVELLEKLKGRDLVALVDSLGQRGDKSARDAVAALVEGQDEAVRAAAIEALGRLGDATAVDRLAKLAATPGGPVKAARASLARLSGPGVDEAVVAGAADGQTAVRVVLIRAIADRGVANATAALLKAAADADEAVRSAAVEALGAVGAPECYPKLMDAALNGAVPAETAEKAILAVAARLAQPAARVGPVLAALPQAKPAAKALLIRVLRGLSGPEALTAVRAALADADPVVLDAAVRALADWADESPADDLLKLIKEAPENTHRVLALRGYLRMARATKGGPAEQLRRLQQVAQVVNTPDAKKMLLAGLGDVAEAGALHVAGSMLGDQAVEAEAKLAVLKIAGALARTNAPAAREAVDRLLPAVKDKALADQLSAAVETANRPAVDEGTALKPDAKRSEDLKKALAKRAPQGFHLACYLDCGADAADGAKGGPTLKVGQATPYFWPESDKAAHFRFGTVWYNGDELLFETAGLDVKKAYQIGFSWWDFDGNGRTQSVFLAPGKGGEFKQVLKATKLPDFKNSRETPAEFTVAVPPNLYADGSLRISFRQNGTSNVVVSEVWLWEGGEGSAKDVPQMKQDEPKDTKPAAGDAPVEIKRGQAEPGRTTKVLIVTGIDYPGHKWQETYPVVLAELNKDKRLLVDVAESPNILCSPAINDYAALIIHFMNWEKPDPGEKARANLKAFVEGGKGMVLTHFACGAFQDGGTPWPEFGKLAGRAWDRKLRGHDPYGRFQVRLADVKHPITDGLEPFEVTDELYTCLAGETPITVLAVSTSKVDKKDYAIAFVLEPGKGRAFHTVLGHDAQVWRTAGPAELLRRGTAWAAGLPPVADRK